MLQPSVSNVPGLVAMLPNVLALPKEKLGAERRQMNDMEMLSVEVGLKELLALTYLCRPSPVNAPSPGGSLVNYPRWAEIYYAGPLINGARKRYIVVSNDFWNQQPDRIHLVVRTTTQMKSPGTAFPEIEGGRAQACCGDITSFKSHSFDMIDRPTPERLYLADMALVANGLAEVLGIST